jgi:hypothetical protein
MNFLTQDLAAKRTALIKKRAKLAIHGQKQLSQLAQVRENARLEYERAQKRLDSVHKNALIAQEKLTTDIRRTVTDGEQITAEIAEIDAALSTQITEAI